MQWRIIHKTMIQKVFTAMIALFLTTVILFIARSFLVAGICLAGFGFLFWMWRRFLNEEMILAFLALNGGRAHHDELAARFPKERIDDALGRLIKKDFIKKENGRIVLTEAGEPQKNEDSAEEHNPKI